MSKAQVLDAKSASLGRIRLESGDGSMVLADPVKFGSLKATVV